MSDDLDRRLHKYAERWRSTVPTFTLDPATLTAPTRPWWPAVVAGVLVVALVGVGALLIRPRREPRRPDPSGGVTDRTGYNVEVSERDLSQPVEGQPFSFAVTLTATRADIPLDVCPDFTIGQQRGTLTSSEWDEQRYALNCDAVPGHVLPQGVPVTFRMETVLYLAQGKHDWNLEVPDLIGAGLVFG